MGLTEYASPLIKLSLSETSIRMDGTDLSVKTDSLGIVIETDISSYSKQIYIQPHLQSMFETFSESDLFTLLCILVLLSGVDAINHFTGSLFKHKSSCVYSKAHLQLEFALYQTGN